MHGSDATPPNCPRFCCSPHASPRIVQKGCRRFKLLCQLSLVDHKKLRSHPDLKYNRNGSFILRSLLKAKQDKRKKTKGIAISEAQMDELSLHRGEFHGDWNYELHLR